MNRLAILYYLLLSSSLSIGQDPGRSLETWALDHPIEKIYFHFDRENYIAGETAWFKTYLYADYTPDIFSSNLYVELTNDDGAIISRNILPVISGTSRGQFDLPDSLPTGYYIIRAYTAPMLNEDAEFIFQRRLYVYGKNKTTISAEKKLTVLFFPEGGNLVEGLSSSIAFKATDEYGLPVKVSGHIRNSRNEKIVSFNTYHDGMGVFEMTPLNGVTYQAILEEGWTGNNFPLPVAETKGVILSLIPHPQGSFFEIKQSSDPAFRAAYMIGQMQHHVVFRQELGAQTEMQGVINTLQLHSGILQVTVFNRQGMPLAERLCFVNNREYVQPAELLTDTLDFSPRGKNRFSLNLKDTIRGSFSISVTDPDFDLYPDREENIYSRLLLSADLPGYIHNAAWYFKNQSDSGQTAMDLLMMTNGWRRFKWTSILQKKSERPRIRDLSYITLEGRANLRGTKKPFSDKDLLLLITVPGNKRITQLLHTDPDGNFRVDSLLFFGQSRILFSDIRGKKSQYIDVSLSNDQLTRTFDLPAPYTAGLDKRTSLPGSSRALSEMNYTAIINENGLLLENVNIKVVKKRPVEEVDERYTTGAFSSDANRTIDLVNSEEAMPYDNIFDYLQSRINGLVISRDGLDYTVYYRQSIGSVSSMGSIPMMLFLDEIPTDASFISAIPANQVALVKIFSSLSSAAGNAAGGALAIYTKKGNDYVNRDSRGFNSIYEGYSVVKEFYAPDYRVPKEEHKKRDYRVTLDWRPDIFANFIDPSIPFSFYNNDRTKRFRVVMEGMTTSGKMVCVEKIVGGR